jgi:ankyrin repeat protein
MEKGLCEKCNENLVAHGLQLAFRTALSAYPLDHINCVRHLYKMGACPNTEYNGLTPLCLATWCGTTQAIEFLLIEARANVNKTYGIQEQNALEILQRRSLWLNLFTCQNMAELLLDHEAIIVKREGCDYPRFFYQYRAKLAACRLAQRALARCLKGSVSKDLIPVIVDMVWSTRGKQEWNNQ